MNELYNHILLAVFLHIRGYSVQPPASEVQAEQGSSLTPTSCTTTGMHSLKFLPFLFSGQIQPFDWTQHSMDMFKVLGNNYM